MRAPFNSAHFDLEAPAPPQPQPPTHAANARAAAVNAVNAVNAEPAAAPAAASFVRAESVIEPPPPSISAGVELPKPGEWQQLWLAMQARPWRSLCIVPATHMESNVLLRVAHGLRRIGMEHLKQPLTVFDHRGVTLRDVESRIFELNAALAAGGRALVVIDAIEKSPVSARYADAKVTDAALLVFILGASQVSGAVKTVESFGKERFLGSLALRSEGAGAKAQPAARKS